MVMKRVECLSVRDRGRAIKGDVVRVCYRSPTRMKKQTKYSIGSSEKCCDH